MKLGTSLLLFYDLVDPSNVKQVLIASSLKTFLFSRVHPSRGNQLLLDAICQITNNSRYLITKIVLVIEHDFVLFLSENM